MIITIHQPDFMPWYGFFNKISKVDTWVVLDHVHNNPRKAFWGRRVQILSNGKPLWLSIPLEKPPQEGQLGMPLNIMKINLQEKKNISKSLLDQIQGIGRQRKRALLNHFGSARAVESASFDDLKSVEGIEDSIAKKIYNHFHE